MNIQHSSRQDDWMTPVAILELVRAVLGTIDFDPASSAQANARVRAKQYKTVEDDALQHPWPRGSIYLNPPGGKLGNKSKTVLFWQQLIAQRFGGYLTHAIFMAFSIEALQSTQQCDLSILDFPICVPRRRIAFDSTGPVIKSAPSHSNVIVYVPGTVDDSAKFKEHFSSLGQVKL